MVKLERKVRRIAAGERRDYVVELHPPVGELGPTVLVREKGRRLGYAVTVGQLYVMLAQRDSDNARARRRPRARRGRL